MHIVDETNITQDYEYSLLAFKQKSISFPKRDLMVLSSGVPQLA